MSPAYSDEHVQALKFLAVARQADPDFETSGVYLIALADLDSRLVMRACRQLALEPRLDFMPAMPAVGTIRALVAELARADAEAERHARYLPRPASDEPTYVCLTCLDGYWVKSFWCPGRGSDQPKHARHDGLVTRPCVRRNLHAPHTWTEKCSCVETNPVVQQQLQTQRGFASQKAAKR